MSAGHLSYPESDDAPFYGGMEPPNMECLNNAIWQSVWQLYTNYTVTKR